VRQRAEAERWMDWAFTFQAAFRPVFWGLVRTPPERRDAAAIEDGRKKCAELLGYFDAALSGRKYVAGTSSPSATSHGLPCATLDAPADRAPKHAALEAWFGRLLERPAYRKVVDVRADLSLEPARALVLAEVATAP
jgi:glutathione S-transferase